MGPGDKKPEEIAEEIINASDESLDDLTADTEIYDQDDYDEELEDAGVEEISFGDDDALPSDSEDYGSGDDF